MKFACSSRQVIPDDPFWLMGYVGPARDNPAEGVRDIPEVNTMCIDVADHKIIFSVIDVCVFSRDKGTEVKKELVQRFALNEDDINIIAIHSHSCPNGTTSSGRGFNKHNDNPAFFSKVKAAIIETVQESLYNLCEARAEGQISKIAGFYSNRNDIDAPYDNEAIAIRFLSAADARLLGMMMNVSCHSTVLGPKNMLCSYDLLGTIRKQVSERYGCPVIMSMGAAGDISNRQYRQGDDFDELNRCASGISDQIIANQVFQPITIDSCETKIIDHVIDYDNRSLFPQYHKLLKETEAILADPNISKDQYKLSLTSKVQFENKLKVEHVHKDVITNMHILGDLCIVGFGGELSSKFGRMIKAANNARLTMIITCCDDDIGYFIEAEKYGKYYETIATDVPKGDPETITDKILRSM